MSSDITIRQPQEIAMEAMSNADDLVQIRMNSIKYPRLRTYTREQRAAIMYQIVLAAYLYRGQRADEANAKWTAATLVEELMHDGDNLQMQELTFVEIGRAVKRAALGQGKEMFGITITSLYQAIASYCRTDGNKAFLEALEIKSKLKKTILNSKTTQTMIGAMSQLLANKK